MDIAKIFENGRSQAVRLPKEYRFSESEVYIKKIGDAVMLIPKGSEWELFDSGIREFSEDYLLERNQPEIQARDKL